MESVSRSRLPSKKSSSTSNGYAGKAIYDDVFGGPPQFGVPTLSPRAEDYSEIFERFHSSRASSIPVLDLPVVHGEDISFDVRSSKFDYSEVFGGFNTLDFAVSYEQLFNQSNGVDDSSDEDWTPAQSDSLSDGSDPLAFPEKNLSLPNPDPQKPYDSSEQLNETDDKINPKQNEDISNCMVYVNNAQVQNDIKFSTDIVRPTTEGKRLRKTMSQPSNGYIQKESFVSVSNISLRTQPSQVPPPSRPPPPLAVKKGDFDELGLKLRASRSFEKVSGENSPPYFDVEIDASSSAAASAAAMKDAVEKAQAKLRSAKELKERKKDVQIRTKVKHEREENGISDKMEVNLVGKSRKYGKEREGSEMWTEGSQFYEVVEKEDLLENGKFLGNQEMKANAKTVNEADKCEEFHQFKENQVKAKQNLSGANVSSEKNESDLQSKGIFEDEDYEVAEEHAEKLELETKMKQQKEEDNVAHANLDSEVEQNEKNLEDSLEKREDESKERNDCVCEEENDINIPKEAQMQEGNENRSQEACETEESIEKKAALRIEKDETGNFEEFVQLAGHKLKESDKYEKDGEYNTLLREENGRTVEVVEEKVNSSSAVDFQHEKNPKKGVDFLFDQRGSKERLEERDIEERLKRERRLEKERLRKIEEEKERERENERLRLIEEEKERENERLRLIEEKERENERLRLIEEEKERENERLRLIEEEKERENERLRKIEEEKEREREREKDRTAVDRANLESRERANVEARERAERAAVERATLEFRQRAMAEAREKLEKATAEARLRAEQRAAVDRATAEARERAAEKVLRHSYSSSDLEGAQFQNAGPYSGSRFLHTSVSFGVESESAQRCKARLERHQRTAERAANALAEKNKRDLLAQREQAERNRLAENLGAEVKRWSSGKEGNLRALLSTLQYILGPDSGWQPVPLTEVITAAAVKKAYRKATLCVHPDKLQQRGATVHQKYICEKVFDLLKEAWNKFNSEER